MYNNYQNFFWKKKPKKTSTFLRMNFTHNMFALWKTKSHLCLWKHLRLLISSGFVLLYSVTSLFCYSAPHRHLIPSANTTRCADLNMYICAMFSGRFKFTQQFLNWCFPADCPKIWIFTLPPHHPPTLSISPPATNSGIKGAYSNWWSPTAYLLTLTLLFSFY